MPPPGPERAPAGTAALRYPDGRSHRRSWTLLPDGLSITDELRPGRGPGLPAAGRLTLHPDCTVAALDSRGALVKSPAGTLAIELEGAPGDCRVAEGWYAPAYGVRLPAPVLTWPASTGGGASTVRTRVRLLG